jgi:hypothetical protein
VLPMDGETGAPALRAAAAEGRTGSDSIDSLWAGPEGMKQ